MGRIEGWKWNERLKQERHKRKRERDVAEDVCVAITRW